MSYVITSVASGHVLDASAEDGFVHLQNRHSTKAGPQDVAWQMWDVVPDHQHGGFKIVSVQTGGVLDVIGASSDDGAALQIYPDHAGLNQRWFIRLVDADAMAFIIAAEHSGKVLDASAADGIIRQYPAHDVQPDNQQSKDQQWLIDRAVLFSPEG